MTIWNSLFWKDVAERIIATLAQVLIALLTADGFDLLQADVKAVVVTLAVSAVLVLLKAIVANVAVSNTVSPASLVTDDRGTG